MYKVLQSAAAVAIVASALSFAGSVQPSKAEIIYPWCAHYGGKDGGGAPSCGSTTYAQCMATVSGTQGYCAKNPFYHESGPTVARKGTRS
jgi:hypothetical protein